MSISIRSFFLGFAAFNVLCFIIFATLVDLRRPIRILMQATMYSRETSSRVASLNANAMVSHTFEQDGSLIAFAHESQRTYVKEPSTMAFEATPLIAPLGNRSRSINQNVLKYVGEASLQPYSMSPWSLDPTCTAVDTKIEDILCMNRPKFATEFRNPCWYEGQGEKRELRCLPYFHIIGVCKSGTTDLFRRMLHHPSIVGNRGQLNKETWFWAWKRYGHADFYRRNVNPMQFEQFIKMFDVDAIKSVRYHGNNGSTFYPIVTGHGDPMDFWDLTSWREIPQNDVTKLEPDVMTPDLIKHVNPNVKLILLLRDPIERLFSSYLHSQFGTNSEDFHSDVMETLARINSCTRTLSMRACLYSRDLLKTLKVPISGSFYSVHLKEWLRVFPRKQIFVLRTEDFSADIAGNLLRIIRFLNLEYMSTADLYRIANMPHFYETKKTHAGQILNKTRIALREMFEPYNVELANMLNDVRYLWRPDNGTV